MTRIWRMGADSKPKTIREHPRPCRVIRVPPSSGATRAASGAVVGQLFVRFEQILTQLTLNDSMRRVHCIGRKLNIAESVPSDPQTRPKE